MLLRALETAGFDVRPQWLNLEGPHQLLVEVETQIPEAVGIVEDALTRSEVHAVDSAQITAGIIDLIDLITGRASNGAWSAITPPNRSRDSALEGTLPDPKPYRGLS